MKSFPVDPSFGSHFFQNVTSMRIGYFTIDHKNKDDLFYIDFADTSYTIYLNSIARLKEVLFRMSINNENNC